MYNIPNDALALATITTIPQKVNFDDNGRLESVRLTSSSRRALLAQDEKDAAPIATRRLDFDSCSDCEEAYDAACEGALSVCDLEDFGYPLSAEAAASVDIVCGNFGSACSRFQASVACLGQCTPEGVCRSINNCWLPRDEVCMIFNCFVPASDGFFCTRCYILPIFPNATIGVVPGQNTARSQCFMCTGMYVLNYLKNVD